jgi:hypothetical protein
MSIKSKSGGRMGAFCVFGVSLEDCKIKARRKVKTYDKAEKRPLTQDEWAERVQKLARELFESWSVTPKQISPAFDAPQFCEDWLKIAAIDRQVITPRIMCRGEKIDPKGAPVIRKGAPVIGWIPYAA